MAARRWALLLLVCGALLPACERDRSEPQRIAIVPAETAPEISGEVFLKLTRGIDALTGVEVRLYTPSVLTSVTTFELRTRLADAALNDLNNELRSQQAREARRELLDTYIQQEKERGELWHGWTTRLTRQSEDFLKNKYNSFAFYDPITEQRHTLSWHRDRIGAERIINNAILESQRRMRTAMEKSNEHHHELAELGESEKSQIAGTRLRIDRERMERRNQVQVAIAAAEANRHLQMKITDSTGSFRFRDIEPGNYVVFTQHRDPLGGRTYVWLERVTVEGKPVEIVLSQTNAFASEVLPPR